MPMSAASATFGWLSSTFSMSSTGMLMLMGFMTSLVRPAILMPPRPSSRARSPVLNQATP